MKLKKIDKCNISEFVVQGRTAYQEPEYIISCCCYYHNQGTDKYIITFK
jgi:hypothetical protein